jgi:tetratricopeptide (TPR) repeat protein
MKCFLASVFALFFLASALADTVHLKDGGTISGKVEERADEVIVTIRPGMSVTVKKDEIKQIVREETASETYQKRLSQLKKNDVEGYYQLALWCKENGLREECLFCLNKAIEIYPDHTGARKELGYVRYGDSWILQDELMANLKGLVKYKGRWMMPQEKKEVEEDQMRQEWSKRIRSLILAITGSDDKKAKKAQEEFMAIRDSLALDSLQKALTHRSDYIRYKTAQLLANFPPDNVTTPLVERALIDSDKSIRAQAAKSLRSAQCQTAYIHLLKAFFLNPSSAVRNNAVDALILLKDKNSVAPLIEAVAYESRRVAEVPLSAPEIFLGSVGWRVIGYKEVIDSHGGKVAVPIVARLASGWSSGGAGEAVEDVVFNLGAREILKALTDQDFNYNKPEWRNWWAKNKDKFDDWLNPKKEK